MEWLTQWLTEDHMAPTANRRTRGTGSVYQRKTDGLWLGTKDHGFTASGGRRRITVTAKTEGAARRKLDRKVAEIERGEASVGRATVKVWAHAYLSMRVRNLTPKAYNAAASPIRRWVIPTIGHRRLSALTPGDVRAVHDACRRADRQAGDVHRVLHTMLEAAIAEGHSVPPAALKVKAPTADKSDRAAMTVDEGLVLLELASTLPHGSRWLFTLLYGARMGECLGLTWDAIDLDAGEAVIEWQLQPLPYLDRGNKSLGFRVPDGHESRHLVDSYHLVRPKSRAGFRVAPLLPFVTSSLQHWREIAPESKWGLVWPTAWPAARKGRPANDKHDRLEWHALQGTAGIGHPAGRPYHVHECRNFAATMLIEAGVPEHVITDLIGHSSFVTSLRYRTKRREPLMEAMQRVGERLQLD